MKKLSNLFYECAYRGNWQTINTVDYKFIENEKEHALEIYFMGSSQTLDWVRNFLFLKKPYKEMEIPFYVHSGFLTAWKEVDDIIIEKITEKVFVTEFDEKKKRNKIVSKYKFNKIITVGYSHGGAISGLCHECVWYHRPDIRDNIFGFGFESPRFYYGFKVKKALRERWENYTVIRNHNDIVTHAPPRLFGFTHVGKLLHIKDTETKDYRKPKFIGAHFPDSVLNSLKEYIKNNFK